MGCLKIHSRELKLSPLKVVYRKGEAQGKGVQWFYGVDPLTKSYPMLTPYQFASNSPIACIDLDGLEAVPSISALFRSVGITKTTDQQLQYQVNQIATAAEPYAKFGNGLINTTFGTVGTIASVAYISGSGGTGAALGGSSALMLSLGEVAVGFGQMSDAISGGNSFVHKASTLPGVIAAGSNSPYTETIDAFAGIGPAFFTSGGIKAFLKDGLGVRKAFREFTNDKSILSALDLIDSYNDASDFVVESVKLLNNFNSKSELQSQTLNFAFSYTIKKGDTLADIAKRLNTSVDDLAKQNNISDVNSIKSGQKITYNQSVSSN